MCTFHGFLNPKKGFFKSYLSFSEKIFDWIKENYLFESIFLIQTKDLIELSRISLIQTKDLFELNNICLIQTKYLWAK